jgi:hypothetical protein
MIAAATMVMTMSAAAAIAIEPAASNLTGFYW